MGGRGAILRAPFRSYCGTAPAEEADQEAPWAAEDGLWSLQKILGGCSDFIEDGEPGGAGAYYKWAVIFNG